MDSSHLFVAGEDIAANAALGIGHLVVKGLEQMQRRFELRCAVVEANQQILHPHRGDAHHHQQAQSEAIGESIASAQDPAGGQFPPCGHGNRSTQSGEQDRGVHRQDGLAPPAESPEDGREVGQQGRQRQGCYQRAKNHRSQQRRRGLHPEAGDRRSGREQQEAQGGFRGHPARIRRAHAVGRIVEQPLVDPGIPGEKVFAQRQQADQAGQPVAAVGKAAKTGR